MGTKSKEALLAEDFEEEALVYFQQVLSAITDPRRKQGQRYPLKSVLIILLLANIAGANSAMGFEVWAQMNEEELVKHLELPHGVPTQDVFLMLLASLDFNEFCSLYDAWIPVCLSQSGQALNNEHLACDGKTSRRSYDSKTGKLSAHTLGVMAVRNGILLSQMDCSRKTNEISTIPAILKRLSLKGATVTIDAIATQTQIMETIVDNGGDFIIGLKGNQRKLYEDAKTLAQACKTKVDSDKIKDKLEYAVEVDKGHGRIEQREIYVARNINSSLREPEKWNKVMSIIMVVRTVTKLNPKENQPIVTTETQYYVTNKTNAPAEKLGIFIRDHWKIENSCHWVLDVVFREDDARNRAGNSAKNFAILRRMALAILKSDNSKLSINLRRMKAGWCFNYLINLVGFKEN